MAGVNGNIAVPGGQIGSGEAQVFNPMPTLNVLAGFQNREDQQAKLDAIERMKAEALKAKAEKPIDYPEFDIKAKGGLFRAKFAEDRANMHREGLGAFQKAGDDPYKRALVTSEVNNTVAGKAAILDQQEERFYKTAEQLQKDGYSFDPDREAYELTTNDNYLNPDLNVKLIEKVKTNPRNFNFAQVGTEAENIAGKVKRKVTNSDDTSTDVEFPNFIRPSKNNPFIREISVKDAVPVLLQTPGGRQQFPILVTQSLKEQGVDPMVIEGKDVADLTPTQHAALLTAQKKAVEKYFAGRGDYSIVQDFTTTKQTERDKAAGARLGDIQIGQPGVNSLAIRNERGSQMEAYIPNSTPLNSPKTPVGLPAGTVVYPTGYYGDKEQITAGNIQGTNAKTLKQNVTARNFVEADGVPIATQRVELIDNGKSIGFAEKGEVIGQAINNPDILKSIPGRYEKRNGYFAAPDFLQLKEEEDSDGNVTVKRSGPSSTSLIGTVFIPDEAAGSIRAHFGRKSRSQRSPTRIGSKIY